MLIRCENDRVPGKNGKGCLILQKDVSLEIVANTLCEMWAENPSLFFQSHEDARFFYVTCVHTKLVEGAVPIRQPNREAMDYSQPTFRMIKVNEQWLVWHWEYDVKGLVPEEDREGWFFCYRSEGQGAYSYFEISPWHVDRKGGIERPVNDGISVYYPPFQGPWPNLLLIGPFCERNIFALGVCNATLRPENSNPLTLLLRSENPEVRDRARRITSQIQVVRDCLQIYVGRLNVQKPSSDHKPKVPSIWRRFWKWVLENGI